MKRVLLVSAVMCLCAAHAEAQARAGLHGGLSRSALVLDSHDTGFRQGFIGGGWVRFPIVGAAALQLGAYYVQKGSSDTGGGISADVELDYLEVPLLLAFLLNRTGSVSGTITAGGALSVERGCTFAVRGAGASAAADCEAIRNDEFGSLISTETIDIGFVLGGGVEWDQGPIIFTLDARGTFGLTEAFQLYPADGSFEVNAGQNLNLALMAGIAFPIGPRPTS